MTDWLSEIEGRDCFPEIILKDNGIEARLNDIINRIKQIKAPNWMDQAKKAHTIREKRNLVHAKLCLKESEKNDEKLCFRVVRYLKQIIETRYGKK